jgi:hypothetical protein
MSRSLIGRFQQARSRPPLILSREKGTREPSFFTTLMAVSSIRSYVVYRRLHERHSRRRRIEKPSWQARESITRSLSMRQKGHFMVVIIHQARAP